MTASDHRSGKSHNDENFPVASILIEKPFRAPIFAFYDFVRTADDIADHVTLRADEKLNLLNRLEAGLDGQDSSDPEAVALRRSLADRRLTDRHAKDLLRAFRQDVSQSRYETFEDLMAYCSLSAMPVGRFVLDVHGESQTTWPASDAICAALQIINHLQDCGKDFRTIDRVYLPTRTLEREGAVINDLGKDRLTPALRRVVDDLITRTRTLLRSGEDLPLQVQNRRLAMETGIIHRLASRILDRLRDGDPLAGNVHLRKDQMLATSLVAAVATLRNRQKKRLLQQTSGGSA